MTLSGAGADARTRFYERLCARLERVGLALGITAEREYLAGFRKACSHQWAGQARRRLALRDLEEALELADIGVRASSVLAASKTAIILAITLLTIAEAAALVTLGAEAAIYLAPSFLLAPCAAGALIRAYPHREAARRAREVLKHSTEGTSLMIMSLRLDGSVANAMLFASRRNTAFSRELRKCIWSVLMGACESFEEALHRMGARWSRHSGELRAAMSAVVTASREGSEEGRRRALERANSILALGAKRRIEEYALSLGTPSMVIFSLGILLPLMVGSFLPMLSWDVWNLEDLDAPGGTGEDIWAVTQTVVLMNVLFPLLAFSVAADAASRHPVDLRPANGHSPPGTTAARVAAASLSAALGTALSLAFLDGILLSVALLAGAVLPFSLLLLSAEGPRPRHGPGTFGRALEDMLFRTGARMVEGENIQAALNKVGRESSDEGAALTRMLSFRSSLMGLGLTSALDEGAPDREGAAGLEAIRVVAQAAQKDERAAGLLAMDLAAYLRELSELESTMKSRLRPTLSMMSITARYLGPVVLGVTYSIYLSLAAVAGGGHGGIPPEVFFLVLGVFLAETNAIATYFVSGVGGMADLRGAARALGLSLLISESIFAATALATS